MALVTIKKCGTIFTIVGPSVEQIFLLLSKDATEGVSIQVDESNNPILDKFTWKVSNSSWIGRVVYFTHTKGSAVDVYNNDDKRIGSYCCDWDKLQEWLKAESAGQFFNSDIKLHPL
jgi:hypothetical protein